MQFPYTLEVQFEDGFTYTDPEFDKVFAHVLHNQEHGKIRTFSAIGNGQKHTIDLQKLPEGTRPIHYVIRTLTEDVHGNVLGETARHFFGYQYTKDNKNHKAIKELT